MRDIVGMMFSNGPDALDDVHMTDGRFRMRQRPFRRVVEGGFLHEGEGLDLHVAEEGNHFQGLKMG